MRIYNGISQSMTPKEALNAIKKLLSGSFADTPPLNLETAHLTDGTQIQISSFETGGDILITTSEGNQEPAPVGNYELEDSRIIVVTEPGKIAEIKDTVTAPETTPADPTTQQMSDKTPAQTSIDDLKTSFIHQEKRYKELQKELEFFKQLTGKTFNAFLSLLETDSTAPITPPKQTLFSANLQAKESAKQRFLSSLNQINKKK